MNCSGARNCSRRTGPESPNGCGGSSRPPLSGAASSGRPGSSSPAGPTSASPLWRTPCSASTACWSTRNRAPRATRSRRVLSLRGLPFTLVDTAGLRVAASEIEREGVRRGAQALRRADIALLVFDASVPLQEEDLRILARNGKRIRLPVLNKSDLPAAVPAGADRGENRLQARDRISRERRRPRAGWKSESSAAAYPQMPAKGEAALFTLRQERLVKAALQAAERKDRARLASGDGRARQRGTEKEE